MPTALLDAIGRVVSLSPEEAGLFQHAFEEVTLEKDEYWLQEGDICRFFGFVEKGLLRFYINEEGREVTHYFSAEGEFVCNYESLLTRKPSRKYIQALEPCVLWTITRERLETLYKSTPAAERFGRLLMERELLLTINRFLEHYTFSPQQRYQYFLEKYPHLANRIPQYHIASYVGVQPQSLSRIRKKMTATAFINPGS